MKWVLSFQKMDFLKAEIERKKRQIAEKNVMQPEKKYFKRGDLAEAQAKEYNAIHAPKMAPQPEELPDEQPETKRLACNVVI